MTRRGGACWSIIRRSSSDSVDPDGSPDGAQRNPGNRFNLHGCSRIALRFIRATVLRSKLGRCTMKRWFAAAFLFAFVLPADAADQVKLVVPFAAGGPVDLVARTIAPELPARLRAEGIFRNR